MLPQIIFLVQVVLGYVACLFCFGVYVLPTLRSMSRMAAQRVIATIHSFRFFGLVFLLPGVVGPHLPAEFAMFAAYGDFVTGVLALLALLTVRVRLLFWFFVIAFNLVGMADILLAYYHAIKFGLPAVAGQLGTAYLIPILYVPMLIITHFVALYWLVLPQSSAAPILTGNMSDPGRIS
jgi:hypothetical protein